LAKRFDRIMNEPGETGPRQSGPGFENALRTCLLSGIVLFDGKSNRATVSPEARQILGLAPTQGGDVSSADLPESLVALAQQALARGEAVSARELTPTAPPGSPAVSASAVPLKSISNDSSVVLTVHALSTNGPFLQQIRQLDRLANTGTLAAGMAHEIKNALVAGRTFLDLLLEKNNDAELVQIVRRETGRIDAIVGRMLRFAAANTTAFNPLHLHEVLDHALRLVQPQFTAKSIVLNRSFKAEFEATKGDEYELQQAFVNLLLNGIEAVAENGAITVATDVVSSPSDGVPRVRILVQDSGSGILPEHMRRLFEPFFTTKTTGTGLGLVITRRIVEEHGGSITAESRHEKGTTFTVLLPLLAQRGGAGGPRSATLRHKPS
jgi:two-component system, NtrC family, nitrogen regulation sensor histidine kinase GlnL